MPDLTDVTKSLIEVTEQIRQAKEVITMLEVKKSQLRADIIQMLKDSDLEAVSVAGKTIRRVTKRQYSIMDMDQFIACDDAYHTSDLMSINANRLNAFCRKLEDLHDGVLPPEIASSLKAYEYDDLSITKLK